jgi:UDP-N-acetylglucosamine 4,6-dehydratase
VSNWTLVTGGTGTVGSELVRTLLRRERPVRVLSRDEGKLADLRLQLEAEGFSYERYRMFVGDVRDKDRLLRAMEGVSEVYHAAALKHVDSCEYNPYEAVKTNIQGVQNIAEAAAASGVKAVVSMSSDKAAGPNNLMGSTKLVGERLTTYANSYGRGCRFMSVRFGNILGSRGSVIPIWREQMRQGHIKVTDPRMTRYVMSVGQAVDLCLLASRGSGGEVFVLQMPVICLDTLARAMVSQFERNHNMPIGSIETKVVGARPGETLDETIVTDEEAPRTAACDGYYAILPNITFASLDYSTYKSHVRLSQARHSSDEQVLDTEGTRRLMREWNL